MVTEVDEETLRVANVILEKIRESKATFERMDLHDYRLHALVDQNLQSACRFEKEVRENLYATTDLYRDYCESTSI